MAITTIMIIIAIIFIFVNTRVEWVNEVLAWGSMVYYGTGA
jgi:hypothetical protein